MELESLCSRVTLFSVCRELENKLIAALLHQVEMGSSRQPTPHAYMVGCPRLHYPREVPGFTLLSVTLWGCGGWDALLLSFVVVVEPVELKGRNAWDQEPLSVFSSS